MIAACFIFSPYIGFVPLVRVKEGALTRVHRKGDLIAAAAGGICAGKFQGQRRGVAIQHPYKKGCGEQYAHNDRAPASQFHFIYLLLFGLTGDTWFEIRVVCRSFDLVNSIIPC